MNLIRFSTPRYNTNRYLVDELFNSFLNDDNRENESNGNPATNIFETDKEFAIELLLPGMKKSDVQLSFKDNLLTVKAENVKNDDNSEKYNYYHREFGPFNFEKQFTVPKNVDGGKISAKFSNGILHIVLPKKKETIEKSPLEIKIS